MAQAAVQGPPTTAGNATRQAIPFRKATIARTDILPAETNVPLTSGTQKFERVLEGSGYVYGIGLEVAAVASGNAANVAFTEDAPWCALDTVVYKDVNGELINLTGYDLYLANLIEKQYAGRFQDQSSRFNSGTTGSGGSGGTFDFFLRVPIALNRRSLTGIVGNQDRAQKYTLRSDLAGSGAIYSTPPTTLPNVTISKTYENYAVPLPTSAAGAPQQVVPPDYGTLHFITSTLSESSPVGGAQVNHYLRRIGNTIRWIALVFRSNGSRASADTNAPTTIQFKAGDDTQFTESYQYRRAIMFERFGFDFPNGVLVYDAIHDLNGYAGAEIGSDYWHTQTLTQAQFLISYPSGFGSTNNSLKIITDDLLYQAPVAGLASVVAGR